jgi:DNA-binding MarR family transcriptional regulator
MQEQSGVSIADFSVLVQLSEHVDARMRILELARALGWEKSRLSHQLTRMQQRGLIERSNCSEDRRGAFVVLTDQGRDTVERAAPRHVESVRRYVFDRLTAEQVESLGTISATVVQLLDAVCAGREDTEDSDCG